MGEKRKRRSFTKAYKAEVVALIRKSGKSVGAVSREFEPTAQSIWNWVRQAERDQGVRQDGLTTDEKEELRRLRREIRVLREEKEILKKAALGSTGQRNTLVEYLCWTTEVQRLSRTLVQLKSDPVQVRLRGSGQIGAFRKVRAQQTVGVLVRSTLPRALWIAEVDLHVRCN